MIGISAGRKPPLNLRRLRAPTVRLVLLCVLLRRRLTTGTRTLYVTHLRLLRLIRLAMFLLQIEHQGSNRSVACRQKHFIPQHYTRIARRRLLPGTRMDG